MTKNDYICSSTSWFWFPRMVGEPRVQAADTDGYGPRRRRRPALSCVECRIRKVKCDRQKPCESCKRIESATCSYRSHRAMTRSRKETSRDLTPTSVSESNSNFQEDETSLQPPSIPYKPTKEFDIMINRYIAPGLLGRHGPPALKTLFDQWTRHG